MKHIKLILDFFYRNKLKSLLVLVILTSAMIIFTTSVSQIRYYSVSLSYIDKPEFKDGLLLQTSPNENFIEDENERHEDIQNCRKILDAVSSSPYVEGIAGFSYSDAQYGEVLPNIYLANEFTAKEFKPNISEGCWLNECEEGNIPNIVLGGTAFKNVSVGSDIELTGLEFKNGKQKFHVIGKVKYPYYSIHINSEISISNIDESDYTGDNCDTLETAYSTSYNTVFICDNDKNRSLFSNNMAIKPGTSLLAFKEGTTEAQREEVKSELRKLNRSYTYDGMDSITPAYFELNGIIDHTKEKVSQEINGLIPFNAFALIIATVSAVIVSLLCVKQKQQNDYVAFLCGCGKRKNLLYTFLATALLTLIPTALTMLRIAFVPTLAEAGIIHLGTVYFDVYSYLYVIIYAVFILAISFLIPSFSIIRKQPIDLYRNRMKG